MKSEDPESEIDLHSMAVLKLGKLAGYASMNEVRDMLFVQNKIKSTEITSNCTKGKFGYSITNSKTKVTAKELNGIPHFYIKIKTEGTLDGTECVQDFKNPYAFEGLEESINKKMETEIKEFFHKTKEEFNADVFGLGELLREQDYKHFKKYKDTWDDGYAKAQIHITFNSEIKRSGLRKDRYIMK